MSKEEILEKVKVIIANGIKQRKEKLTADQIKFESNFIDDLGANSLDVLEIIMAIEDEFDLDEIPEEDIEKIRTVGDAVDYLVSRLD